MKAFLFKSEFIRFATVGVVATAIHYGVYLLLIELLVAGVAYTIGYVVSFCCNFLLTNVFTFRTKPTVRRGMGFAFSHLVNWGLHIALLAVFIRLGVGERLAPVFVYAIAVPVNFLLLRTVFRSRWSAKNSAI
jgi:putative flippase GtrA